MFTKKIFKSVKLLINSVRRYNVTVVGGASELGQVVSLLLRGEPAVTKLTLHDTVPRTSGVLMDLSHIPSPSLLACYKQEDNLMKALLDADIVLVTGGHLLSPDVPKDDLVATNTNFIKQIAPKISSIRPMPLIGIVTEPIHILVPMAAEIMKCYGHLDSKKLFGVTGIDSLRAQAIYAGMLNLHPQKCSVPVICGHTENTIVPLLSQAEPSRKLDFRRMQDFLRKVRQSDELILTAKCGFAPSLSIAYSVLIFTRALMAALDGKENTKVDAFIENNDFGTSYFGGRVRLNHEGVAEMERYPTMSEGECELLQASVSKLRADVLTGKKMLEME
ncbi:malate dehydrogenase-like [Pectinophora gossypiella]|uniref:malate dehydrogenase-like n=1 Tax=Pectinophora gossypiella TaxID=13191 RepID=UPI00214ED626|nr:malate dehydrogenase-like [Pectinophora gossypiella]